MYTVNILSDNKIDIEIIKGNTFREQIRIINDARLGYVPSAGDEVLFQVFNKYSDDEPLFEKRIPYDTLVLDISAKETDRMKINNYVYRIRLIKQDFTVDDVIFGKFIVKGGM